MRLLLIVPDNDSYTNVFPLGLAYIAAVCRNHGHEVSVYCQDVYHYSEEHLVKYLEEHDFDVVGTGACGGYYQYRKILKISAAVKEAGKKTVFIIGGHLVSPEPEFFLRKTGADYIVIGEGENTMVELLSTLENQSDISLVDGIAYLRDDVFIQNKRRELITDIDSIPFPAWDLFPITQYALLRMPHIQNNEFCMPVYSGRGCTFKCNFCYRMDAGFRPRSISNIIEEVRILKERYNIRYIAFMDELLVSTVERATKLCEQFIKADLNIKWDCNGRLNYAKPELLQLMKQAGCVFINYGIESMDDTVLRNMNKSLTTEQIITGIENTLAAGISPGYNIIFGNIGETKESLQKGVEFLLKYDDHSQLRTIRPVTPYPGCPLYYTAIEKGLLKNCEDFYENKHVNSDLLAVNFTELTDEEFHQSLFEANERLLRSYYEHALNKSLEKARALYMDKDSTFRGFRQI